jgi:threonine dehydratase
VIRLEDISRARDLVGRYIHRTPLVRSQTLSERLGTNAYLKLELFQKTGSFKPRGAFNQLLGLPDSSAGVVGFSGGNFAQGLAFAGRTLGIDTTVVMPASTPANYVDATRGYGAKIDLVPDIAAATDRVAELVAGGKAAAHPFDNPDMMAGNGTIGLEIVEDVPEVTDVIVSIGGGGLITGVATAVSSLLQSVRVWGVETEGADAMSLALAAGEPVSMTPTSIAKTLAAPYVSEDTLEAVQRLVEEVVVVPDAEAYRSMVLLLERAKVLTEPAAGCTLTAADRLQNRLGDHVVIVLCGGNVSLADLIGFDDLFSR